MKVIKKLLGISLILFICACSKERINADGNQITEIRQTQNFKSVSVAGSSQVSITYGTNFKVELKGSSNLIANFTTRVVNNELLLKYEKVNVDQDDISVYITMPALEQIRTSGSAGFELFGIFPQQENFRVYISGSGNVNVSGELASTNLHGEIAGSGNANLEKIASKKSELEISGSGNFRTRTEETLKVKINGSGNVYYFGNPVLESSLIGAGKLVKL